MNLSSCRGRLQLIPTVAAAARTRKNYYLPCNDYRLISTTVPKYAVLHHEWIVQGKVAKASEIRGYINNNNDGNRVVLFLHGLLGNGKNLRTPAKLLTKKFPSIRALVLDLRGHGITSVERSGDDFNQPHNIDNCANDIIDTVKSLNLTGPSDSPIGVVGHSFGGRCALSYTHALLNNNIQQSAPDGTVYPPQNTWLLDTVPGVAHPSVSNVVKALSSIETPILNKKELAKQLVEEKGIDPTIAAWMTTNLTKSKRLSGGFDFMFDLNIALSILNDFPNQNFIKLVSDCITTSNNSTKMHLVIAGKNNEWTKEILENLKGIRDEAPNPDKLQIHTLPNAGHWVHVDDIQGLMKTIESEMV